MALSPPQSSTSFLTSALFLILTTWAAAQRIPALSPSESMATIQVPEGFRLECVASEPMIEEPVMFAFDGQGAMYVCEWRTYMQDEHASGQMDPISRVVKLVDTDGDGKMDQRTVFIDECLLPRTILPLADRVLVNLTGSNSVWAYFDDDHDGVADRRELAYQGRENGGNIEHQASGLVWNLDNFIDTNYQRLKWRDGKLIPTPHSAGRISQWGLARDDDGHLYCTWAGGKNPAHSFQFPAGYPIIPFAEHGPDYTTPYSICATEDQSSGGYDYDNKRVLLEFSAPCGQTVIRSQVMGEELQGVLLTCEPTGRFIRATRFDRSTGGAIAHNLTPESEFIRSSDTYFRPTWSDIGPDGTLYFADMYRGIIQEKDWFPTEGDHPWVERYHRVKDWGMIEVRRHGRIYRLVPEDRDLDPQPKLDTASTTDLVANLDHRNSWWRDKAQKYLVLRNDQSAVPALKELISDAPSEQGVINALWTLEGLNSLDKELVLDALQSDSTRVRSHGIRLSEPWLAKGDSEIHQALASLPQDTEAQKRLTPQLVASYRRANDPVSKQKAAELLETHPTHPLIEAMRMAEAEKIARQSLDQSAQRGGKIYESMCMTCHGKDGKGIQAEGTLLAPPFHNNPFLKAGSKNIPLLSRIILDGLSGELRGEQYGEGIMTPFKAAYDDQQIADVLNYITTRWGGNRWKRRSVSPADVAKARRESKNRTTMWTEDELKVYAKKVGIPRIYFDQKLNPSTPRKSKK